MRVNRFGGTQEFQEFDITLTVESEEEARALYAIFNYSPNLDLIPGGGGDKVRGIIGRKFANAEEGMIANGVTYEEFYRSKESK